MGEKDAGRKGFGSSRNAGCSTDTPFLHSTVEVGDPPQLVKLSPDTGSFETWMNPNCENSASPYLCVVNGMYHPENSELAVTQNELFDFSYGNGWVNGKYYEDRIYFRSKWTL